MDEETKGEKMQGHMITLTYADDIAWNPNHITKTLNCMRQWCARRSVKFRYVWVAEIQEKRRERLGGHCVHYHIVVWLPRYLTPPKFDKRGWWIHGMTQGIKARSAVGYLAKYASKGGKSTDFPKHCRINGTGGLTQKSRWNKTWWMLPKYVRDWCPDYLDRPVRAKGGGFLSRATGELLESIYEVLTISPLLIQLKVS